MALWYTGWLKSMVGKDYSVLISVTQYQSPHSSIVTLELSNLYLIKLIMYYCYGLRFSSVDEFAYFGEFQLRAPMFTKNLEIL